MKKLIFLWTILTCVSQVNAQEPDKNWYASINFKVGQSSEMLSMRSGIQIYDKALNLYSSGIDVTRRMAYGAGAGIGYYFDRNKHWGVSTGITYLHNQNKFRLDSLHYEYRSVDFNSDTFRQVISSSRQLSEEVTTNIINIPLLFRYRADLSSKTEFSVDFGLLYNVVATNSYTADAAFNYEALYKFVITNGNYEAVYDYSSIPGAENWKLTRGQATKDIGEENISSYFQELQSQGYNVGLDQQATGNTTGKVAHKTGSIGVLIQPSFNFRLSDAMTFDIGAYLMMQRLEAKNNSQKMLTDKIGEYNSLLNNILSRRIQYYGLNLGVSYRF